MQGIYYIKNTITEMIYVGASVDIDTRWYGHKYDLAKGKHKNKFLQADYDELGLDVFEFGLLEEIKNSADLETREAKWIKEQTKCYNIQGWRLASRMADMPKILKRLRSQGLEQAKEHLGM